jgi:hypothetical protein
MPGYRCIEEVKGANGCDARIVSVASSEDGGAFYLSAGPSGSMYAAFDLDREGACALVGMLNAALAVKPRQVEELPGFDDLTVSDVMA